MSGCAPELRLLPRRTGRAVSQPSPAIDSENVHDSPKLGDAVAYRINQTNRLLLTHLARFLDTHQRGLTPEKWFLLARLREDGPLRQVELTEPALGDAPNVSRLVDGLTTAGLVERNDDPTDRRCRILSLSVAGASLADELHQRATQERRRVFAGLADDDLQRFTEALDRIDGNLRALLTSDADRSES